MRLLSDLQIASVRNELVRDFGWQILKVATPVVRRSLRRRVNGYARQQARLRLRYGIGPDTPITSWSEGVQESVDRVSAGLTDVRYAFTSGSTSLPKKIPYTSRRLRHIKRASFDAVVQVARARKLKSPVLFVLAAIQTDDSLSNLLLDEGSEPSFIDGLVMPSRYIRHPGLASVVISHGPAAVRLCLIVLSNPGILYATNPSTLASFLHTVEHRWAECSRLLLEVVNRPDAVCPSARRIFRKVVTRGWQERARVAASARGSPGLHVLAPGIRCYCCWDGGYVEPFLNMIRRYLPTALCEHIPMYSMSTECLQTQVFFIGKSQYYLPIAPDILYEFLPEDAEDDPDFLLNAEDLEEGRSYSMVVSDPYGLSRYQTDDVFLCVDKVQGIPDLRFHRRRGLVYSFTGEKITGQQVETVCARLCRKYPSLQRMGAQMMLIPAFSEAGKQGEFPHYRLVVAHTAISPPSLSVSSIARDFDALLAEQNLEFAAKRDSGRLGRARVLFVEYDRFARLMKKNDCADNRSWENQFKLVPLCTRRWDELGLPPLEDLW